MKTVQKRVARPRKGVRQQEGATPNGAVAPPIDTAKIEVVSMAVDEQDLDAERWHAQFAASPSTLEEIYDDAMREYLAGNTIDIG